MGTVGCPRKARLQRVDRCATLGSPMIQIASLLTEQALADEFVNSFAARRLDEKFFYWFPLSVRALLALCSDGASRYFVPSRSLTAHSRTELAGQTRSGAIE